VIQTQKKLKNAQYTEFIGVFQSQSAILAETQRLANSLVQIGVKQRYLVNNRCEAADPCLEALFPAQTIVHLPVLLRSIPPREQVSEAANLLF
jgi:arsenite-transporting ATPase